MNENLESIAYFCTTLKNLTVNNELICLISEKKPFQLLKIILKNILQVIKQINFFEKKKRIFCLFLLVKRSN